MPIRLPTLAKTLKKSANPSIVAADVPCVLIDEQDAIIANSGQGSELALLWQQRVAPLAALVTRARATGAACDRVELQAGPIFWVTASQSEGGILLIGRDVTVPERMTSALMHSRALLKGLLERACAMAFELDAHGRFRFIAPAEPFDVPSKPWLETPAESFFFSDGRLPGRNPLQALADGVFASVRAVLPGGQRVYLDFDMAVERDDAGEITARTGVVRDVTAEHDRAADARQTTLRLQVESQLTHILNSSESAEHLLERATAALSDIVRADTVWMAAEGDAKAQLLYQYGDTRFDLSAIQAALDTQPGEALVPWPSADHCSALLIPFQRDAGDTSTREGFAVIARDTAQYPWSEPERLLLKSVGATLTAAFLRAKMIDRLSQLSSRDSLTQLLNRRALGDAVNRRLAAHAKVGKAGVLLFIDLDHFKELNDTAGHKAGDQALKEVAQFARDSIRPSDLAGRYGGDEFIIWLDDIDVTAAEEKAQALIDFMPRLRARLSDAPLKLGASVGLCQSRPNLDLDFEALAEKADAALYAAKQHGKGRVIVAGRADEGEGHV